MTSTKMKNVCLLAQRANPCGVGPSQLNTKDQLNANFATQPVYKLLLRPQNTIYFDYLYGS